MIKKILPKEIFVSCIEEIQTVWEYQKSLNQLFRKYNVGGYIYQPDCVSSLIKVLHTIWGDADCNDYIEKFCFETNFGKKPIPDLFLDQRRQEVTVSSPAELYEFLLHLYEY